ncbi:MAG: T9SS C-terminal target domain-containing protein [Calditrichaeota bacterium]|nr:MAG: T9SS C-terminal target domain-containing protein [Calditrichota bacterium]
MNERYVFICAFLAVFIPSLLFAQTSGFSDDFNSGTLDPINWQLGDHSGNFSQVENNQLALRSVVQKTGWVYSANAYDLDGKNITIKVIQPNKDGCIGLSPTVSGTATTGFYSEQNWYRFYNYRSGDTGPYKLYVQWRKNGAVGGLDVATGVDFQSNFYLRIRSENQQVYFEYSFDNSTWELAYDEPFSLPGYSLSTPHFIEISAYSTPSNGEWLVDDFAIENISTAADTTAPQIQNLVATPTVTEASLSWETDEPATSSISWGETSAYGNSADASITLLNSHQITLTGLLPETTYHFQITATDAAGNQSLSSDFSFTTDAEPISNGITDDFNSGGIDPAIWGLGNSTGNQTYVSAGELHLASSSKSGWLYTQNSDVLRNKSISLKVIHANEDGALGISPTLSPTATNGFYGENNWYRFYNYRSSSSGTYKLYVQWRKNGVVGGLDVATDQFFDTNFYLRIFVDETMVSFDYSFDNSTWVSAYDEPFDLTNVTIDDQFYTELSANNTASNGEWIVDDFAWVSSQTQSDTTAPVISQLQVLAITESAATIQWQTDEPATAQVEYGLTSSYGQFSPLNSSYQNSHSISVENLLGNTTYHFRVSSQDAAGNSSVSADSIFTTLADVQAPLISGITINSVTKNSVNLSWQTDEFAFTRVEYGETNLYGEFTDWTVGSDTSHNIVLQNLLPETLYHFRILAKDAAANESASGDTIFTTLSEGAFFSDNFDTTQINTDKWFIGQNNGNQSAIVNQQLELKSTNGETGWVITQDAFVARQSTARMKITQPNDDGNLGISPTFSGTASNGIYQEAAWYRFYVYRSSGENFYRLYVQWRRNGAVGGVDVTGSLRITGAVWLQMRFDDSLVYFDMSLDGTVWHSVYSEPFNLDSWTLDSAFHYEIAGYRTDTKGEMRVDDFSLLDGSAVTTVPAADYRVLLVGNSITEGVGSSDGQGFRPGLQQQLTNAGYDFTFVGAEGNSPYNGHFFAGKEINDFYPQNFGNGIGSGLHDVANAMQIYQPNVVMIHLGTNDLTLENYIAPYSDDGGATFNSSTSGQMASLISYILQWSDGTNGAFLENIFLSQIIPGSDRMAKINLLNSEIGNLIQDFQNGTITGSAEAIQNVDHFSPINANPDLFTYNENDYMSDYLHPNDLGYGVMADTYFNAFSAQLPVQTGGGTGKSKGPTERETSSPGPVPNTFALMQNYPNPFAPQRIVSGTTIEFQLPVAGEVKLEIFNILGQHVTTLINNNTSAGFHKIAWDGRSRNGLTVAPGMYFYVLQSKGFSARKKLTILR